MNNYPQRLSLSIHLILCGVFCSAILLSSCSQEKELLTTLEYPTIDETLSEISFEQAVACFDEFLGQIGENTKTSSYKIDSYFTHYSYRPSTRGAGLDSIADAYFVNFANDGGFAVLAANNSISPIVAYVENGNCNDFGQNVTDTEKRLVYGFIESGLQKPDYGQDPEQTRSLPSKVYVSPALTYDIRFDQTKVYCHRNNGKFALCGCGVTAVAIVSTYFGRPSFVIDSIPLNYSNLDDNFYETVHYTGLDLNEYFTNASDIPSNGRRLKEYIRDNVFDSEWDYYGLSYHKKNLCKLQAAIFYTANSLFSLDAGTALTFAQEEGLLDELGYGNVDRHTSLSIGNGQLERIADMLLDEKPVIMGLISRNVVNSHYVVIDGMIRNLGTDLNNLHINWGWSGRYNGWFDKNCIRSTNAQYYDDYASHDVSSTLNYSEYMEFCVFTYDNAPSTTTTKTVNTRSNYRQELNLYDWLITNEGYSMSDFPSIDFSKWL